MSDWGGESEPSQDWGQEGQDSFSRTSTLQNPVGHGLSPSGISAMQGVSSETLPNQELAVLQEHRDKAFERFFALDQATDLPTNDPLKWNTPNDAKERLKAYVKSELALQQAKIKSASPKFDTDAESSEMMFQNADRYLEVGQNGRDALARVLKRLYSFQKERELKFGNDPNKKITDNAENLKEWNNIMACQLMVADLGGDLISPNFKNELRVPDKL